MAHRFSASAPLDAPGLAGRAVSQLGNQLPAVAHTARPRTALSFEVIPPRRTADWAADEAGIDTLLATLSSYNPDYIAVTSSQRSDWLRGTADFIARISHTTAMRPLAHLACTAGTREELTGWIDALVDAGVRGLLALRGDLPTGARRLPDGYLQHADDLVRLIRQRESQQVARFAAGRLAVGVACYPNGHAESANADEDFDVLLAKQRAGADLAITQLFFDAEDYLRFAERARLAGVTIPLIPGIMPMTSIKRLERMSALSGVAVPDRVAAKFAQARGPDHELEIGLELTCQLTEAVLAGGAGGLHLYTHNDAELTRELLDRVGIAPPAQGRLTA